MFTITGGPPVTRVRDSYVLIGIVSWGEGCALADYSGVYARVSTNTNRIRENIEEEGSLILCPRARRMITYLNMIF